MQAWFARRYPGRNPYRLFALSNLASLLALVGYPFLLEPWVPTRMQALAWSVGYGALRRAVRGDRVDEPRAARRGRTTVGTGDSADVRASLPDRRPPWSRSLLWCGLAATGSVLLLSVTNHITQNIAAVPLLWIVPLTLYLLTFILCFDSSRWYPRELLLPVTAATLGVMAWSARRHAARRTSSSCSSACSASGFSSRACSATASSHGRSRRRAT